MPYESISSCLEKTGLCVLPNFISPQELQETRTDFDQIQKSGGFTRAGTGQGVDRKVQDIRQDKIFWLDRDAINPAQATLWHKLDMLQTSFNRNLFLGLSHFEGHYSSYPAGGFYRRHLDSFRGDNSRVISFVLYLNKDWRRSDGGQLRIYAQDSYTDIDPCGGTMVSFLSRESEHEVLENHKERSSFTGWFKTAPTLLK